MSTVTFDKLAYSEALKAGGFTHEQATVQANALDTALRETVATKHDIELLRSEIRELEQRMTIKVGYMLIGTVTILLAAMGVLGGFIASLSGSG